MPKKPVRNSFYYYMLDFKEEQRSKGINYANMKELAEAAGPSWTECNPSVRAKYEAIAKKEKQKSSVTITKYTSTGIPIDVIKQREQEQRDAEERERKDITNMVKLLSFNKTGILNEDIYLIDVNSYCFASSQYIIAEMTILRFNLQDGIKDNYHEMINPGKIPLGYASDAKVACENFGLEMPDPDKKITDYLQILANIKDYLNKNQAKTLPMMFTMPDKVEQIKNFILQLCITAAEDDNAFRVYNLHVLFFTLINAIKTHSNEGLPTEPLALAQLKKDVFRYTPEISCEHHESVDKVVECTASRVKRWAFTILDSCCPIVGIEMEPGKHLPADYDTKKILMYKEEQKERMTPNVSNRGWDYPPTFSSNSSFISEPSNDIFNATLSSVAGGSVKEERTHQPLRMPKTDYSKTIRPPPELTESNFPALSAGVGRGRGLSSRFSKMNIKN